MLDLYQLHAVATFEELEKAMRPGGAIETLVEAREKGLTRYLGITGHGIQTPAVHAAALERFDFDTVMFPLNPPLYANPDYRRDAERLLQLCADRDVGVMIIKSIARGPWGEQPQAYTTWYQPHDLQEMIDRYVHFALSQYPVTGIPAASDVRLLPMIVDAAERFQPLSDEDQIRLLEESTTLTALFSE